MKRKKSVWIDEEVANEYKILLIKEGRTMQDDLEEYVKERVEKSKEKETE